MAFLRQNIYYLDRMTSSVCVSNLIKIVAPRDK